MSPLPEPQPAPETALSRYVTTQDVADALRCSDDFVRELLADGVLPYLDIARRTGKGKHRPKIRIPAARVEAYLEANTKTAPRPVSA